MLAYSDIGSGTPIVFVHGLGSRKEAWYPQTPLANRYRLIVPDLRGHGATVQNKQITVRNFASDILELLDALNIDTAFICGLSLGGIIAQEIYRQAPARVRGLILANTTAYIAPFFASAVLYESQMKHRGKDFVKHLAARGVYDKRFMAQAEESFLIRECYMAAARAPVGINYFPTLRTMDKPVLLISGAQDRVTPPINQDMMSFFLRNVQRVTFKDTGHLSNIEKSEDFNETIHSFIA